MDSDEALAAFCLTLEKACVDTVQVDNIMTKDLALSIHGKGLLKEHYVSTQEFISGVEKKLKSYLTKRE